MKVLGRNVEPGAGVFAGLYAEVVVPQDAGGDCVWIIFELGLVGECLPLEAGGGVCCGEGDGGTEQEGGGELHCERVYESR